MAVSKKRILIQAQFTPLLYPHNSEFEIRNSECDHCAKINRSVSPAFVVVIGYEEEM